MGCFSWVCPGCQHSIRSTHATNRTSKWMSRAVLVTGHGATFGVYDGYGRIESPSGERTEFGFDSSPSLFHEDCYNLLGRPSYRASKDAPDQGYFVGSHHPARPKTLIDVAELVSAVAVLEAADAIESKRILDEVVAKKTAAGELIPAWLQARK